MQRTMLTVLFDWACRSDSKRRMHLVPGGNLSSRIRLARMRLLQGMTRMSESLKCKMCTSRAVASMQQHSLLLSWHSQWQANTLKTIPWEFSTLADSMWAAGSSICSLCSAGTYGTGSGQPLKPTQRCRMPSLADRSHPARHMSSGDRSFNGGSLFFLLQVKNNIRCGPSIILNRYQEVDKTLIRGGNFM